MNTALATLASSDLTVDVEKGIIRNAAVMHAGPTGGHGFLLDMTSLKQARDLINAESGGVKIHFKHPEKLANGQYEDQAGAIVGRLRNARLDGGVLRGDIYLGTYAKKLPEFGDVWSYLLEISQDDPTALGLSAAFIWEPDPNTRDIVARISQMIQVDVVGDPAANPNGLLARSLPLSADIVRAESNPGWFLWDWLTAHGITPKPIGSTLIALLGSPEILATFATDDVKRAVAEFRWAIVDAMKKWETVKLRQTVLRGSEMDAATAAVALLRRDPFDDVAGNFFLRSDDPGTFSKAKEMAEIENLLASAREPDPIPENAIVIDVLQPI